MTIGIVNKLEYKINTNHMKAAKTEKTNRI